MLTFHYKTSKMLHSLVFSVCQATSENFPKFYPILNASVLSLATNDANCFS